VAVIPPSRSSAPPVAAVPGGAPELGPVPPRPGRDRWGRRLAVAREQVFAGFFFAMFLFLLYQLYRVFTPFLGPIVWAAVLAIVFYPLYLRLLRAMRSNTTVAAATMTAIVTVSIVVPTASLSTVVTNESVGLYQQLTEWVRSGQLDQRVQQVRASRVGRLVQRLGRQGWEMDWGALVQRSADTIS